MSYSFPLFEQFTDTCTVRFFGKDDAITSDEDVATRIGTEEFVSLNQVHGSGVHSASAPSIRSIDADAALTNVSKLALQLRIADCQSFALYDPETHTGAVIHAGWKGLVAGVIGNCIQELQAIHGVYPENVYIAAGPSLCTTCAEFTNPEVELPGINPTFFTGRNVDLRSIAESQLSWAGIDLTKLQRHPDCTRCHPERYYTYRGGDKEQVLSGLSNYLVCQLS